MAKDAPVEIVTVNVCGKEVILDPNNMQFDENSLGEFFAKEYGWVDYLGKQYEFALKEYADSEVDAEALYSMKYMQSKDTGATDNYAKGFALSHDEVIEAKKKVNHNKMKCGLIKQHLNAFGKNHENAQNRGHTVRQEMKMLNRDIYDSDEPRTISELLS